jgi:hypothetical protein
MGVSDVQPRLDGLGCSAEEVRQRANLNLSFLRPVQEPVAVSTAASATVPELERTTRPQASRSRSTGYANLEKPRSRIVTLPRRKLQDSNKMRHSSLRR